jgi:hypothetical protein
MGAGIVAEKMRYLGRMKKIWQRLSVAGGVVVFILNAHPSMGQDGTSRSKTETVEMSAPLKLPAVFSLNTLPQRLSVEDSLDRRAYARNRLKTMTLLRHRAGQPDTAEYYELDRRGNKTLVAKPYIAQHRQQHFDKQNRLVESVVMTIPSYPFGSRTMYDPQSQVHTTYVTGPGAAPALWQQALRTRHGDTVQTDFVFQQVPGLEAELVHRVLTRGYRLKSDTAVYEVIAYNAADQPIEFSAYYSVGKPGYVSENGELDFRPPAGGASAAALLRRSRQGCGRFVPNTRNTYDARGQRMLTTYISSPDPVVSAPVSAKSADGRATMKVSSTSTIAGYTTRYTRTADGRIQRENRTYELRPGSTDLERKAFQPSSIEYEYAPNGLLLRKTESAGLNGKPVVYEVNYTYY